MKIKYNYDQLIKVGYKLSRLYLLTCFTLACTCFGLLNYYLKVIIHFKITIFVVAIIYIFFLLVINREYKEFNGEGVIFHSKLKFFDLLKFHVSSYYRREYEKKYQYIPYKMMNKCYVNKKRFLYNVVLEYKIFDSIEKKQFKLSKRKLIPILNKLDRFNIEIVCDSSGIK